MKKISITIIFLTVLIPAFAQKIHSPAEILKIMEDSKLSYQITTLNKAIEYPDLSEKLNYHDCYRVESDSGLYTLKFKANDKAKPLGDKAEEFYQANNLDSALVYYQLSLAADTSLYYIMTYVGQIYGVKGDYANAINWYKKTIGHNYIDYMAHWFLADTYLAINDLEKALDEIIIAQILNRNNPRIKKSLVNILDKAKRSTDDWNFNPQIELAKTSENKINVGITEKWIGYALAKALWTYEPGYKASMGVSEGSYSTLEDKECLISLLVGLENAKIKTKNDPQLRIAKEAAENGQLNDFILYEIVLPQTPFVAYQLPEQTILGIKDYVLNVRHSK